MTSIQPIQSYRLPRKQDLPPNTVNWMADRRRAVLLIHDMQNYFVEPFGAPLRETLVANIAALRTHCAAVGIPVAYSAQPGGMSEEQRGLLLDFWGPGMQLTPKDRDIVDVLTPQPADWLVTKWRYSAFFNNDLLKKIHAANRDQLIICGVYAHIGVLTTALEAYSNDIQVLFVADATGDFKQDDHRQALKHASRTCAALTTTEEVIRCLG